MRTTSVMIGGILGDPPLPSAPNTPPTPEQPPEQPPESPPTELPPSTPDEIAPPQPDYVPPPDPAPLPGSAPEPHAWKRLIHGLLIGAEEMRELGINHDTQVEIFGVQRRAERLRFVTNAAVAFNPFLQFPVIRATDQRSLCRWKRGLHQEPAVIQSLILMSVYGRAGRQTRQ